MGAWGFLTNHAHALVQVARNPRSTVREIALASGITERATIGVLNDLRRAGILRTERDGRQNVNDVDLAALARHRPWGASQMEIPDSLIDATLRGLSQIAGGSPSVNGSPANAEPPNRRWGFLTTHALCLIYVTQHAHSTVREISQAVGITERATHVMLRDLRESGIIAQERSGRRNSYSVNFADLASFRREGTAPDLVPDAFVAALMKALLALQPAV